jgi:hypothetical protein
MVPIPWLLFCPFCILRDLLWKEMEEWRTLARKQEFSFVQHPSLQACVGKEVAIV